MKHCIIRYREVDYFILFYYIFLRIDQVECKNVKYSVSVVFVFQSNRTSIIVHKLILETPKDFEIRDKVSKF